MKHFLLGLLLLSGLAHSQSKLLSNFAANAVTTPHVRAELMAYAPDGVQPGKPFTVGLQIQHQPNWHTYWKNPGDSGLPTQLTWTLEGGLAAGDIQWPTPKKIPVGNLANYGFEGTVLLAVPITVAAVLPETQTHVTILLKAQWLVCKTECIPEEGEFALKVPVRGSTAMNRAVFDNTRANVPTSHHGAANVTPQGSALTLTVAGLPSSWQGKLLEAFAEQGEMIQTAAKQEQKWDKGVWQARIPLSPQRTISPDKMPWLLKIAGGQNNPAVLVSSQLTGTWPKPTVQGIEAAAAGGISPELSRALAQNKSSAVVDRPPTTWMGTTYWIAVLGALLGGLILNLMPCVLPVLAIKLLGFAPKKIIESKSTVAMVKIETTGIASVQSDETLSFRTSSGLFALGVIASFALLGIALLALRGAGQSLGWGFQLQSPGMVIGLALLFLLIGLNLFDAFELRAILPARIANFQSSNPSIEALASGALAVLVAAPCTAPFMGASLGLAVALPALPALLIFIALGTGMALPFLAIAAIPSLGGWLLKILPKPGEWMAVLRHFLAWPVFATVVWLLWVYAQQTTLHSAFAIMFVLLMVIALLWALRLRRGALRTAVAVIVSIGLVASLYLWSDTLGANKESTSASVPVEEAWQPWSANRQQEALTKGRPVFVDFTAAWCITCQVNKSTTLGDPSIVQLFKEKQVVLLRADWTKPNAAIAAELSKLGRSGLPVYAFYRPGSQQPQLLPEVLTQSAIQSVLSAL